MSNLIERINGIDVCFPTNLESNDPDFIPNCEIMSKNSNINSSSYVCYLCSPGYFSSPDLTSCIMSIPKCTSVSQSETCYPYCNCNACETGYVLINRDNSDLDKGKVRNQFDFSNK
jgi:hypothetical protein